MIKDNSIYFMVKMIYDRVDTISAKYDDYLCTKNGILDLYINGKVVNSNFTIDNIHFGKSWIAVSDTDKNFYIIDKKDNNNITKISNVVDSRKQNANHDQISILVLTRTTNNNSKFTVIIINNKDYRIIKIFDNVISYQNDPVSCRIKITYSTQNGEIREITLMDII